MNTRLSYIRDWPKLGREAKWSATMLAAKCGVSLRTLQRFFLKEMGKQPKAWLSEQRQREASALLENGLSVKEVADILHYSHASHLTNGFKNFWGHSPTSKLLRKDAN